jgi:hypothetical protein
MRDSSAAALLASLWSALGGRRGLVEAVRFEGPPGGLPSIYPVAEVAVAQIGAATLAAAELFAARRNETLRAVQVDRRHAVAAFRSERYQRAIGWEIPPPWDPISGDYRARHGWIRLHTNYASHRAAAAGVLGTAVDREKVARAVLAWDADALEEAVVAAGGCAAALRTDSSWRQHPQGAAVAEEALVAWESLPAEAPALPSSPMPLGGIRVLDLTRVIAGPVCTRFLAGFGADVLRIDPPGFEEVPALLSDTTAGKRRATLDLREERDRATFTRLVSSAHVLVSGYRSDALDRLGLPVAVLRAANPALVLAFLDAYGHTGPWRHRRGFDSLVQMSCGIAARGQEASGAAKPVPLPAQALDHGTGYLLAAAVCRSLTRALRRGEATTARTSLARTARFLVRAIRN